MAGIIAIFLLFSLIKNPGGTIKVLLATLVFPATILFTIIQLTENHEPIMALIAALVMWFALHKFIDWAFKDNKKP